MHASAECKMPDVSVSVAGTHLAFGLSTSRDNAWISMIPFEPAASETSPSMVLPCSYVTSSFMTSKLEIGRSNFSVPESVCAALQTSWKEDVLASSLHPATPVSQVASPAHPRSSLLQQLQWLPDGTAVMAIDRLGNLGAVNASGTVQTLSLKVIAPCICVASHRQSVCDS